MFDTIILLTGPVEQVALASVLCGHNPQLTIYPATASEHLAALDPAILPRARLIAFSSAVIVPPRVLAALGFGAYNFHPGPPDYPGWAPAQFALYDGATTFGATVHVMAERVDSGPIIDVDAFPVPAGISVAGLEGLAYAHLAKMYWKLAGTLATEAAPLPAQPLSWGGRKNFAPRLSGDLRHSARHQQGRAGAPHARVRRQSFRRVADHTPARRGVSRGEVKPRR